MGLVSLVIYATSRLCYIVNRVIMPLINRTPSAVAKFHKERAHHRHKCRIMVSLVLCTVTLPWLKQYSSTSTSLYWSIYKARVAQTKDQFVVIVIRLRGIFVLHFETPPQNKFRKKACVVLLITKCVFKSLSSWMEIFCESFKMHSPHPRMGNIFGQTKTWHIAI